MHMSTLQYVLCTLSGLHWNSLPVKANSLYFYAQKFNYIEDSANTRQIIKWEGGRNYSLILRQQYTFAY
jgi:hypothetical protein